MTFGVGAGLQLSPRPQWQGCFRHFQGPETHPRGGRGVYLRHRLLLFALELSVPTLTGEEVDKIMMKSDLNIKLQKKKGKLQKSSVCFKQYKAMEAPRGPWSEVWWLKAGALEPSRGHRPSWLPGQGEQTGQGDVVGLLSPSTDPTGGEAWCPSCSVT